MLNKNIRRVCTALLLTSSLVTAMSAQATIVEVQTSQGNFQLNLFDQSTPKSVENFLNYRSADHYSDTIIHRSVPGFILQGGSYKFLGTLPISAQSANAAVSNEPVYSNVRGTIAMAKVSGDANSATDQWFVNLADNSANLDVQNGGFTVFGQVIGDGMDVIDAIAAISLCGSMPMVDFSQQQCQDGSLPGTENFVTVYQILIIDSSSATDSDLNPVKNTLLSTPTPPVDNGNGSDSSGGGSLGYLGLLLLGLLSLQRKFAANSLS